MSKTVRHIERFHNELAMRLGYECIVKDKRISISEEGSEYPCVMLTLQDGEVILIEASDKLDDSVTQLYPEVQNEIRKVCNAVQQAYLESTKELCTLS